MNKYDVLHLVNGFSDSSISRIILRLITNFELETLKWHIGGLNQQKEMSKEFSLAGAQVIDFSRNGANNLHQTIREVRKYIVSNNIRIIHTHTPRTIFVASAAITNLPGIKHVSTKHLLTNPSDRKWGTLITLIDRLSLYFPEHLIPVSSLMAQKVLQQPLISKSHVTTIQNAIPQEQFYVPEQRLGCRNELGIPEDAIVLGYTGRIQQVKRIDLLLEIFCQIEKIYPNTRLVIVGDGDQKQQLEILTTQLGISEKVIWTGFRKDIPRILAAIDIYIQVSANEGLSLSILEAMAAGKAVIATDAGGTSEVIKSGETGLLIRKQAGEKLVTGLSNLIGAPDFRAKLSMNGLELIRRDFSLGKMVTGYQNLYQELLSQMN